MIDIRQVVPCYFAPFIHPHFPAQLPVPSLSGNMMNLINQLLVSHD
jgi:hypothetical protein